MKFLCHFVQQNEPFRLPELLALSELNGYSLTHSTYSDESPFLWIELPSEEAVVEIMKRALSIRAVYDVWACSDTLDGLKEQLRNLPATRYGDCIEAETTFRINYVSYGKKPSESHRQELTTALEVVPLEATVNLEHPQHVISIIEDYGIEAAQAPAIPKKIFIGRQVAAGNARRLIHDYKLTSRAFIGTTSMDPELSLLCANMAWAKANSLVYDPFAGTGSLLISCAHFGSHTFGSDIDPRVLRGKGGSQSIVGSYAQYGYRGRLVDLAIIDMAHLPIRPKQWFDAIVCDPPYGIREEARCLGAKQPTSKTQIPNNMRSSHIPQTVRYSLAEVLHDILEFSAAHLVPQGRLVYWLPVCKEDYCEAIVPQHPSLTLVANSENPMKGRWSRRMITMVKTAPYTPASPVTEEMKLTYNTFRDKIFEPTPTSRSKWRGSRPQICISSQEQEVLTKQSP